MYVPAFDPHLTAPSLIVRVPEAQGPPVSFEKKGSKIANQNGVYVATGPRVKDMPAYQNQSHPDVWICYCGLCWLVQETKDKGTTKGLCYIGPFDRGLPCPAPWDDEAIWQDKDWKVQQAITVSGVQWKAGSAHARAVVVGMDEWTDDADLMGDLLVNDLAYPRDQVARLKNATKTEFLDELAKLEDAPEESLAFIYYSGHGDKGHNKFYFRTKGPDLNDKDFKKALSRIKARKVFIMIDACHAGAFGPMKGRPPVGKAPGAFDAKDMEEFLEARGKVVMCASRDTNLAPGSSTMTHEFIHSVRRRNTAGELQEWMEVCGEAARNTEQAGAPKPVFNAGGQFENFSLAAH